MGTGGVTQAQQKRLAAEAAAKARRKKGRYRRDGDGDDELGEFGTGSAQSCLCGCVPRARGALFRRTCAFSEYVVDSPFAPVAVDEPSMSEVEAFQNMFRSSEDEGEEAEESPYLTRSRRSRPSLFKKITNVHDVCTTGTAMEDQKDICVNKAGTFTVASSGPLAQTGIAFLLLVAVGGSWVISVAVCACVRARC